MLVVEADKNTILGNENEIDYNFIPFTKIAARIDECMSLLNFHKIFNNTMEIVKQEEELNELRQEIKNIKKRIKANR